MVREERPDAQRTIFPQRQALVSIDAEAAREAPSGQRDEPGHPAGPADTGPADTGPADTGPADTGPADTGPVDGGAVVTTKLRPPPGRPDPVPRPRLTERLRRVAGRRLTLLSAPAGFGKTTVLGEWLAGRAHGPSAPGAARAPGDAGGGPAVAWVTLDEGDDDPARFVAYLVAALREAVPGSASGVGGMLTALREASPPPMESVAGALVNALAATPGELVLVLDDYHVVEAAPVHRLVAYLIDHLPPHAQVVLSGRVEPPLPLARWRARGELAELHAADLAFTPEEAAAFLAGVMGLDLAPEDVAALTARTEGWAAGLQLAALSLQGRAGAERAGFLRDFSGTQRDVLDFLAQEVLERQPEPLQAFLLSTSVLDTLCGELCDALTGRTDGQATLEALERANLFVDALDHERRWYRYHGLFADFLRGQLAGRRPGCAPELHRRAASWYREHGWRAAAVGHSLAAGDHEQAAALLEGEADALWARGEVTTLLDWLEALPDHALQHHPRLLVERAAGRLWTGQPRDVEPAVQEAERAAAGLDDAERLPLLGYAAAVDAWGANLGGDPARAAALARRALLLLPPDDSRPRLFATHALAVAHENTGDTEAAGAAFAGAADLARAAGHDYLARGATGQHARLLMARGRLREAGDLLRRALQPLPPEAPEAPEAPEVPARREPAAEQEHGPAPATGEVRLALGRLLYEWDDLEEAERYLAEGTRMAEAAGLHHAVVDGHLARSRLRWARGDPEDALALAGAAERLAGRAGAALSAVDAASWTARLRLALGDPAAARRAFDRVAGGDGVPRAASEIVGLATARLLLAEDEPGVALRTLEGLRAAAEGAGRRRRGRRAARPAGARPPGRGGVPRRRRDPGPGPPAGRARGVRAHARRRGDRPGRAPPRRARRPPAGCRGRRRRRLAPVPPQAPRGPGALPAGGRPRRRHGAGRA